MCAHECLVCTDLSVTSYKCEYAAMCVYIKVWLHLDKACLSLPKRYISQSCITSLFHSHSHYQAYSIPLELQQDHLVYVHELPNFCTCVSNYC